LNSKTNDTGQAISATYNGGGEVVDGNIGGRRYFGTSARSKA